MTRPTCHDCGAAVGELHKEHCDIEPCPICGGQLFSCGHRPRTRRIPWSGEWPGVVECRAFGWYAKFVERTDTLVALQDGYRIERSIPVGWVRCGADQPGATEDLNRLHREAVWDRKAQRWEKP